MIDYHIHTLLCNHATGSAQSYVEAALHSGLSEICFLEHLCLDPAHTAHSMHLNEVPLFVYAMDSLKQRYRGRITIRTGLEIDFTPEVLPAVERLIHTFDFDIIGGSVHFVDGINIASRRSAAAIDPEAFDGVSRRYVERVKEMVETSFFDVVCHLDIIKKSGRLLAPDVERGLMEVIDKMAIKNLALEVNSGGLAHPIAACYPSNALLAHAISRKLALTTGSDAHTPQGVGAGIATALATLKTLGATHLAQFEKRQRTLTPLCQEIPC